MKLPIRIDPGSQFGDRWAIIDGEKFLVCDETRLEDARLIVAAVNSHQALFEAVADYYAECGCTDKSETPCDRCIRAVMALKSAEVPADSASAD